MSLLVNQLAEINGKKLSSIQALVWQDYGFVPYKALPVILARCGGKISDVVLDDFRLEFHGKNEKGTPEGSSWYDGSPVFNSAVSLSCVENITLRNSAFNRGSNAENWQYQLRSGQGRGLQIDGIPCPEDCRRTFPD